MQPRSDTEKELVRVGLEKIFASTVFKGSPRQQRFLDYLVSNTMSGESDRLKGYTIAVDVFDRKESFDPNLDAIVRVEATRLRNKLREYYAGQGESDTLRIEFPKGGYKLDINLHHQNSITPISNKADTEGKPALVVLPFRNVGADASREYFVEGISDNLLSMLSQLSGLFVISRQSSFAYTNTAKSLKEIARELSVRYLLEGAVQYDGSRVRVMAYLTDISHGGQVWSERYDREINDIFALQDDLAEHIAHALQVRLAGEEAERFGHEGTTNIQAHDALLRGMQHHWQYTAKSTHEALHYFEQATALDPNYAAAHAWLARTAIYQWITRYLDDTVLTLALQHAKKALELAPMLPHAHAVLGWIHYWCKDSELGFYFARKAVAMDPNNSEAYLFLAQMLASNGQGAEALNYVEKSLQLNPRSNPWCHWVLGQCYYVLKDYEKAEQAWLRSEQMSTLFLPTQIYLCMLYALLGNQQEVNSRRDKVKALLVSGFVIRSPWLTEELEAQHQALILKAGLREFS